MATSGIGTAGDVGEEARIENAILIAGPTASGKSALALRIARRVGGVIVNADSMQVYSVLRSLTARPTEEEEAAVPHLLYGHVHPGRPYSVGSWLRDVRELHAKGAFAGRRPIFTGGTGLYFRVLVEGLADLPDIPPAIRDKWRVRLAESGAAELHRVLQRRDPESAAAIRPADGQRIIRALEVEEASGRRLSSWFGEDARPLVDGASALRLLVETDRPVLHERIAARLDRMAGEDALEEVRQLLELGLDPAMPAMKAIGVREFAAVLRGELPLAEALERAKAATRQYAKRQATWFRHQPGPGWRKIAASDEPSEEMLSLGGFGPSD